MKDIFEGAFDTYSFPLSFSEPTDRIMYSLFNKYFKHRDDHRPGYYSFDDRLVDDITKGFRWYFRAGFLTMTLISPNRLIS